MLYIHVDKALNGIFYVYISPSPMPRKTETRVS